MFPFRPAIGVDGILADVNRKIIFNGQFDRFKSTKRAGFRQ